MSDRATEGENEVDSGRRRVLSWPWKAIAASSALSSAVTAAASGIINDGDRQGGQAGADTEADRTEGENGTDAGVDIVSRGNVVVVDPDGGEPDAVSAGWNMPEEWGDRARLSEEEVPDDALPDDVPELSVHSDLESARLIANESETDGAWRFYATWDGESERDDTTDDKLIPLELEDGFTVDSEGLHGITDDERWKMLDRDGVGEKIVSMERELDDVRVARVISTDDGLFFDTGDLGGKGYPTEDFVVEERDAGGPDHVLISDDPKKVEDRWESRRANLGHKDNFVLIHAGEEGAIDIPEDVDKDDTPEIHALDEWEVADIYTDEEHREITDPDVAQTAFEVERIGESALNSIGDSVRKEPGREAEAEVGV